MYGAVAALRVLVVVLAFAVCSAAVDPDDMLRGLRRVAPRSALTASLATRMVPLLARDAERLGEAYGLRAARRRGGRSHAQERGAGPRARGRRAGARDGYRGRAGAARLRARHAPVGQGAAPVVGR